MFIYLKIVANRILVMVLFWLSVRQKEKNLEKSRIGPGKVYYTVKYGSVYGRG